MSKNPPAFPLADGSELGMTLRDYFAAKAMQGLLSESGCSVTTKIADHYKITPSQAVARWAFEIADAMLVEREKQP